MIISLIFFLSSLHTFTSYLYLFVVNRPRIELSEQVYCTDCPLLIVLGKTADEDSLCLCSIGDYAF
jgi:hypothetical protein